MVFERFIYVTIKNNGVMVSSFQPILFNSVILIWCQIITGFISCQFIKLSIRNNEQETKKVHLTEEIREQNWTVVI